MGRNVHQSELRIALGVGLNRTSDLVLQRYYQLTGSMGLSRARIASNDDELRGMKMSEKTQCCGWSLRAFFD